MVKMDSITPRSRMSRDLLIVSCTSLSDVHSNDLISFSLLLFSLLFFSFQLLSLNLLSFSIALSIELLVIISLLLDLIFQGMIAVFPPFLNIDIKVDFKFRKSDYCPSSILSDYASTNNQPTFWFPDSSVSFCILFEMI